MVMLTALFWRIPDTCVAPLRERYRRLGELKSQIYPFPLLIWFLNLRRGRPGLVR